MLDASVDESLHLYTWLVYCEIYRLLMSLVSIKKLGADGTANVVGPVRPRRPPPPAGPGRDRERRGHRRAPDHAPRTHHAARLSHAPHACPRRADLARTAGRGEPERSP